MTGKNTALTRGSPDRFGYEWREYSEMRPEYEEQFRRWTPHFAPADWAGRSFLDVGCGMGRNSYWPHTYGSGASISIDVDPNSLASARATLSKFTDAEVRALSAYDIDYRDAFDIVFSIGVIHHLAEPKLAIERMVQAAKPSGRVLIWVYGLENNEWIVKVVDPFRKALFSKLPIGVVHHLSLYPAGLLWLAVRAGMDKIEYLRLLRRFGFRHLRSIVFDQLLPHIAHYWSRQAVMELMQDAGLKDIEIEWVNEMSWSAVGTKPD